MLLLDVVERRDFCSDTSANKADAGTLTNAQDLASTANIIASNAPDTANAQHEAIGSLYSLMGLMGQLAVMQCCSGQQRVPTIRNLQFSRLLIVIDVERLQFLHPTCG